MQHHTLEDEDGTLDTAPETRGSIGQCLIAGFFIGVALAIYLPYKWEYDPEKICRAQTLLTREQCLDNIEFARSAGW